MRFNVKSNDLIETEAGGKMKDIVLREIRWFRMTDNSWRRNHQ